MKIINIYLLVMFSMTWQIWMNAQLSDVQEEKSKASYIGSVPPHVLEDVAKYLIVNNTEKISNILEKEENINQLLSKMNDEFRADNTLSQNDIENILIALIERLNLLEIKSIKDIELDLKNLLEKSKHSENFNSEEIIKNVAKALVDRVKRQKKLLKLLRWGSQSGSDKLERVKQLISQGIANVNAKDNGGYSALKLASGKGYIDIVRLLINAGADVNEASEIGWTPLMSAVGQGYLDIARLLLDSGADVNTRDNDGQTALYFAAEQGYINIVRLLINAGADVNVKDNYGQTALNTALRRGHKNIVELLIDEGATISNKDYDRFILLDKNTISRYRNVQRRQTQTPLRFMF